MTDKSYIFKTSTQVDEKRDAKAMQALRDEWNSGCDTGTGSVTLVARDDDGNEYFRKDIKGERDEWDRQDAIREVIKLLKGEG